MGKSRGELGKTGLPQPPPYPGNCGTCSFFGREPAFQAPGRREGLGAGFCLPSRAFPFNPSPPPASAHLPPPAAPALAPTASSLHSAFPPSSDGQSRR